MENTIKPDITFESTKKVRLLIAENIPSLNKGEMTILSGMIESLRPHFKEIEITMFSDLAKIDQLRYGSNIRVIDVRKSLGISQSSTSINLSHLWISGLCMIKHISFAVLYKIIPNYSFKLMEADIWKEYLRADVIIIGHNGTFGLGWGMLQTPVIFYYLYIPFFAKILRKRIVIFGGSLGKMTTFNGFIQLITRQALNNIDLITLRENTSLANLKDLKVKNKNVFLIPDPAFLLPPINPEKARDILRNEGIDNSQRPLIGITVTRQIASKAFLESGNPIESYAKHLDIIARTIDKLIVTHNATIIFIPHCIGYGEKRDDRIVSNDIFQIIKNKNKVKVITNEYSASELKGLIGQLDLFIGERIHSVINALSMCVPSLALSYASDFRLDIIRAINDEHMICYVENLDHETLFSKVNSILINRQQIIRELNNKICTIQEKAMLNGKLLKELVDLVNKK